MPYRGPRDGEPSDPDSGNALAHHEAGVAARGAQLAGRTHADDDAAEL